MTNDQIIEAVNNKFQIDIKLKISTDQYTFARMVFYVLARKLIKFQTADAIVKELNINKSCPYNGIKRFDQLYDQPVFSRHKKGYLELLEELK